MIHFINSISESLWTLLCNVYIYIGAIVFVIIASASVVLAVFGFFAALTWPGWVYWFWR